MVLGVTQRQWDILIAVAEAETAAAAAYDLGLSESTVKNTLAAIRLKTDTTTTLSAYHHLLKE